MEGDKTEGLKSIGSGAIQEETQVPLPPEEKRRIEEIEKKVREEMPPEIRMKINPAAYFAVLEEASDLKQRWIPTVYRNAIVDGLQGVPLKDSMRITMYELYKTKCRELAAREKSK